MRALGFNLSKNEIVSLVREYDRSGKYIHLISATLRYVF